MTTSVTVLGTGIMGAGMTRSLRRAGLAVTVWNRSPERARPLADDGARVAGTAREAVTGADVVVTVLFDADAVAAVLDPITDALGPETVWVQASTVGVEGTRRLSALAAQRGVAFLDAPVLGTRAPAENGQLVVLAAGDPALRARVEPVLAAVGARTQWVSDTVGDASRLKLAVNAWIATIVHGTAQSVALARGLGLDPGQFLEAISGQAVDSPYAQVKGRAMIDGDYTTSFEVDGVVKDLDLIRAAMDEAGTDRALADVLRDRMAAAAAAGHGGDDMAAVISAYRT